MPPERDIDEAIRMHLSVLSYIIENANQRNLQDINMYSEGTAASLLNLMWDTSLKDLNKEVEGNFPVIDLLDEGAQLFIQVTSDDSISKIKNTVDKSAKVPQLKSAKVTPKILLLRFNKPKRQKEFYIDKEKKKKFRNEDVICLNDLAHQIQNLSVEKKRKIIEYLQTEVPIGDAGITFPLEVYLLRKLFESLSSENDDLEITTPVTESEIDKKREKYTEFWQQIQLRYRMVLSQQRERSFKAAFDRIGQADRLRLTQYLSIESVKVLDQIDSDDPNEVIERLKTEIVSKIKLPLVSEVDITHFLYYQFHHCNVLPLLDEVAV